MKYSYPFLLPALVSAGALVLTGCLFKPTADSSRHFVLTPLEAPASNPARDKHLSIGVALVKTPPYLMHNPLAIRQGSNEISYSEQALWAEPLDQGLQRTLAANLATLLPTRQVYLSAGEASQVQVRVFVEIIQLDVTAQGKGTLLAWWRLTRPGATNPIQSAQSQFTRHSASSTPEAFVQTLSELTADLSRTIAGAIQQEIKSAKPSQ